jgi:drug/metabolite transporter (DMT)-like permease
VIPIVLGVAMFFFNSNVIDIQMYSMFILQVGMVCAALKALLTNYMLSEQGQHPIVLLSNLAPISALVMLVFATLAGEVGSALQQTTPLPMSTVLSLLFSSLIAFFLNWTNFLATKATSALTVSITGIMKQVTVVLLSPMFFANSQLNPRNAVGAVLSFGGLFLYTYVKYMETHQESKTKEQK